MFEILPEVPLMFKALILLGLVVLMIGIAGLVLVIGKKKMAKESDTYDIVKKSKKTPKVKKEKQNRNKKTKNEVLPDIESWDDEPVSAFSAVQPQTTFSPKPADEPVSAFPAVQPQTTFTPKPADEPVSAFPAVQPQTTFTPKPAPNLAPKPNPTPKPAPQTAAPKKSSGGPFGQANTEDEEW